MSNDPEMTDTEITYEYDEGGRLIAVDSPVESRRYEFDEMGNRRSMSVRPAEEPPSPK